MGNSSTQLRRNKSASPQEEAKRLTPLAQSIGSSRRGKSPTQMDAKDTCSPSKDACSPLSVDSYGMIAMLPLNGTRPQYDNQIATPPQNML
jgi:hypothetical protein